VHSVAYWIWNLFLRRGQSFDAEVLKSASVAPALAYGLRLWACVSLALLIAYWLQLDDAYWAATSAAVVAQPGPGASVRKGRFRAIGTILGGVLIVVQIAIFPQSRLGLLSSIVLWGAICGYFATILPRFAGYAAALAGYTAAIVFSKVVDNPADVFLVTVTRVAEITIGIICAEAVHVLTDFGVLTTAPRLHRPMPIGDGAALLRRRPDVREAERDLAASTARVGVATAELFPRITLGASVGSTGIMQDFLTASTNRWGFGLQIHWQANQSVARAHVAGAGAENKRALARFDGAVLTALRDTESALATYSRDLQRDEDLVVAQARAQEAERQARRLYAGGRTDFLPLLDAERSLVQADGALANSHAEIAEDQVTIFLALGGGWE
jgi:hypothetical protein